MYCTCIIFVPATDVVSFGCFKDKILAFTSSLPMAIGVGTTNRSVMKFWVGAGVLEKNEDDYSQNILSPKQLEHTESNWIDISIDGLNLPNFNRIRVIQL